LPRQGPTRRRHLILEEQVFVAVLSTADTLARRASAMLEHYGLTSTQYNALRILRGGGSNGLACSEIAGRMINRDPDITRLLDRLQRRGLISRKREHNDRRVIRTSITSTGLELLNGMDLAVEEFHRQLLGHLNKKTLRSLMDLLDRIRIS
jgi:DNA-binding MarR family transcriptional regulator